MRLLLTLLLAFAIQATTFAQVEAPQPSPLCKINQKVGLADVTIEYSRPAMKGRVIFGDLVPYNEVWRLGANGSTKLTISDDATINGQRLAKGTYSLFAIPGKDSWTWIVNKNLELWGADDRKDADDVMRFTTPVTKTNGKVESFSMMFDNLTDNSGEVSASWENTRCAFTLTFDTDTRVMASIKKTMDGPGAGDYFSAAGYYLNNNKDLSQALTWVNTAIEKNGEKYWYMRRKALIQAAMGDYKSAIASATRSSELAKADGDGSYVRQNEKSIAEWTAKMK